VERLDRFSIRANSGCSTARELARADVSDFQIRLLDTRLRSNLLPLNHLLVQLHADPGLITSQLLFANGHELPPKLTTKPAFSASWQVLTIL
jgi:hypothetical protein